MAAVVNIVLGFFVFITGVLLYLGHGGIVVDIHYITALVVAAYIVVHVFCHYMFGGVQQWLRRNDGG